MGVRWNDSRFGIRSTWNPLRYRPMEWVLLSGNRLVISGIALLFVAVVVTGTVLTGLAPLQERTPLLYLLFALISGNFTLITIVVSLSQFVLARHLESPGEIREKMTDMVGYRREVGETTRRSVVPITPSGFFLVLFYSISEAATDLSGEVRALDARGATIDDELLRWQLDELVDGLTAHTDHVVDLLEEADGGLEYALFATLDAGYERYIYTAWRLRTERADDLSAAAAEALDRLVESLEQVDVARRMFKTVFIQSELSSLSRLLLYIGIPVQMGTVVLMLLFTAPGASPVSIGVLTYVIPVIVTLGFAPIVLLAAYILRLATVAQRTAAMYPFTTQVRERG